MTVVYVPVPITSVEQAEALPEGSVIISDSGDRFMPETSHRGGVTFYGMADGDGITLDVALRIHEEVQALVPVEVYEGPGGHGRSWYIEHPAFE